MTSSLPRLHEPEKTNVKSGFSLAFVMRLWCSLPSLLNPEWLKRTPDTADNCCLDFNGDCCLDFNAILAVSRQALIYQ
jgi:hypothetical protein